MDYSFFNHCVCLPTTCQELGSQSTHLSLLPPWGSFPVVPWWGFLTIYNRHCSVWLSLCLWRLHRFSIGHLFTKCLSLAESSAPHTLIVQGAWACIFPRCLPGLYSSTSAHIWASAFTRCFSFLGDLIEDTSHLVPEHCSFCPYILALCGNSPALLSPPYTPQLLWRRNLPFWIQKVRQEDFRFIVCKLPIPITK